MVAESKASCAPSFFTDTPLDKLDLDAIDATFIAALPDGPLPDGALCGNSSQIELLLAEVNRREAARFISGMFGALLREELRAAWDWTERNRNATPSNWVEDVI